MMGTTIGLIRRMLLSYELTLVCVLLRGVASRI